MLTGSTVSQLAEEICNALSQDQQQAPGVDLDLFAGAGQDAQPLMQSNSEAPYSQVPR